MAETDKPSNFIRHIIDADLKAGKYAARRWSGQPGPAAQQKVPEGTHSAGAGGTATRLAELVAALATPHACVGLLSDAVAPEPSALLREGDVIAPGYSADLDELRAIQDNCGAFLVELEVRERERSGIASLKVEFNKVHGLSLIHISEPTRPY